MYKKYFGLLVFCLAITLVCVFGCTEEHHRMEDQEYLETRMMYMKDRRTNLCFMIRNLGWTNGSLTNVPCTPEVEKLIRQLKGLE